MPRTGNPPGARAAVWLLSLLVAVVVPLSAVGAEEQTSAESHPVGVLLNPGFEEGFREPEDDQGVVATGWAPWWLEDGQDEPRQGHLCVPAYLAEARRRDGQGRVRSGGYAQGQATTYATHTGGLRQQVPVVRGSRVSFSIWAYVWSSSENDPNRSVRSGNYEVSLGIDPHGGTDPAASEVVWSSSLSEYDRWVKLSVLAQARAGVVTLFTRGEAEWRVRHNHCYWDDAWLQMVAPAGQALQATPTPSSQWPTDGAAGVLENPDFEGEFSDRGASEVTVADHWQPWWMGGSPKDTPAGYLHRPEYKPEMRRVGKGRVRSGASAQKQFTTYATHDAGIYQQVSVIGGSTVSFSIWAYVWSSSEDDANRSRRAGDYAVSVGIDPYGGTDGTSDSIVWSEPLVRHDRWVEISVRTVAKADTITVFTRGKPSWRVKHNDSYWDDASLEVLAPAGQSGWASGGTGRTTEGSGSDTGGASTGGGYETGREPHLLFANHRLTLEWWRTSDRLSVKIGVPTPLEGELDLWEDGELVGRWAVFVVPSDPLTVVWRGPAPAWRPLGAQVFDQRGHLLGQCGRVGIRETVAD